MKAPPPVKTPPFADLPARSWILAVVTLLVIAFPCLMAGRGIDAAARPGETARLQQAIADPGAEFGGPAVLFYGATLPARASTDGVDALAQHVPMARLASLLGVLCASVLLYLTVLLARGRTLALIACLCFGIVPAVGSQGYILRPEIPVTVFGLLGVLVLQNLPNRLASRRRRPMATRAALSSAYALVVGTAFALSAASSSQYGICLLVPGGCLLLCILLTGYRFILAVRRRPTVIPLIPLFVRVAPWFVITVFSLVLMAAVFAVVEPVESVTRLESGLLPAGSVARIVVLVLAPVGGMFWVFRAGMAMGRWRRLTAEIVLLVYCVALLLQRLSLPPGADALPAAGPLAVCLAEGVVLAMLAVRRGFARSRRS